MVRLALLPLLLGILFSSPFAVSGQIECSHESGVFDSTFVFRANASPADSNGVLRYALGGEFVTRRSSRWRDSLVIDATTTVEVGLFNADTLADRIHRFFAVDLPTNFPVLAVSTRPANVWDEQIGMAVRGPNAYFDTTSGYWRNANYERKWEREVNVVYVETDGGEVINQRAGFKVFGGMSRHRPQKSFRIIARKSYGKKRFKHEFFARRERGKFKSLVLRNSSSDYNKTRFHDVFGTQMARGLDLEYQEFQPIILYINDEYQGIYNLREFIRKHFLIGNWEGNEEEIDLIQGHSNAEEGDAKGYQEMYKWVSKTDLSDDQHLPRLHEWMDVRNYLNFLLYQIFIGNKDSMGNIRIWRPDDASPFRWILYDTDLGLGASSAANWNYMQKRLSPVQTDWFNRRWSTSLITNLLENEQIKADFIHQACWITNVVFDPDRADRMLDSLAALYAEDVVLHRERLGQLNSWENYVEKLRRFVHARPAHMLRHTQAQFDLSDPYWLELRNPHPERGGFRVNDNVLITDSLFEGWFFSDYPLKVEWIPEWGFAPQDSVTWLQGPPGDTLRASGAFGPAPLSPFHGKVRLNEWHPRSDSMASWMEFIADSGFTIQGAPWTLWTSWGRQPLAFSVDTGRLEWAEFDSTWSEAFEPDSGWWRLLDAEERVIDSLSWAHLPDSAVYERRDSSNHRSLWGISGPGTPDRLNPDQMPPPVVPDLPMKIRAFTRQWWWAITVAVLTGTWITLRPKAQKEPE